MEPASGGENMPQLLPPRALIWPDGDTARTSASV